MSQRLSSRSKALVPVFCRTAAANTTKHGFPQPSDAYSRCKHLQTRRECISRPEQGARVNPIHAIRHQPPGPWRPMNYRDIPGGSFLRNSFMEATDTSALHAAQTAGRATQGHSVHLRVAVQLKLTIVRTIYLPMPPTSMSAAIIPHEASICAR